MHRLLERQLRKCFGSVEHAPPELLRLLELVSETYRDNDENREMLDRCMQLSSRELSERNAELAVAERKYRAIFENSTEGIFQIGLDGKFISANPALARLYGYDSADQLIAMIPDVSDVYVDVTSRQHVVDELLRRGTISQHESQIRRRDQDLIWISETARVVYDTRGEPRRYEGTVYEITKRRRAEIERQTLQERLMTLSRQSGMAEVATGLLHNVGNVLNSINTSASLSAQRVSASRLPNLVKAVKLLTDHRDQAHFLSEDSRGKQLPGYLAQLAEHLVAEQRQILSELKSLMTDVDHIKQIVSMQQEYAKVAGVNESVIVSDLVEDALRMNTSALDNSDVEVVKEMAPLPRVTIDKHYVIQIVMNLVSNARYAMRARAPQRLTIRTGPSLRAPNMFVIEVSDTGIGIPKENITRIFNHGFTTKSDGHGFGLHSSALAAQSMGGSLIAQSDGPYTGATFILELPMTPVRGPRVEHYPLQSAS